jgi:hypothetical protein
MFFPRGGLRGFIAGYRHFAEAIDAAGSATEPVAATRSRHRHNYDFPASLATTKIHSTRIRTSVRLESHCDMSANRRRPIARETYSQNRQEFFLNMPGNNAEWIWIFCRYNTFKTRIFSLFTTNFS